MDNTKLIQLIRESINEYIREIDKKGDAAAAEAKMKACQEAIALREKKIEMSESLEEMKDMVDPAKIKTLKSEIKTLEKSLKKYQKQLDKINNKAEKVETEEKEIVDEVELEEMADNMDLGEDTLDSSAGSQLEEAKKKKKEKEEKEPMNESFLHMQKLAGLITETQYKEKMQMLNEDRLVLSNYAKQLYSLFKKAGATPLVMTSGKNFASPDVKNHNVSILVNMNDELMVGIKGDKATATNYSNLVAKQFPDLKLKGDIKIDTGWGGEQDSYASLVLVPKTTKKGGVVNPNQRPNAPKPASTT